MQHFETWQSALWADGQTLDNCQPADVLRLMDTLRASLSPPGVASAVAAVATMMDMLGIPLPRDKLVSMYLDGLQKMACKSTDRGALCPHDWLPSLSAIAVARLPVPLLG